MDLFSQVAIPGQLERYKQSVLFAFCDNTWCRRPKVKSVKRDAWQCPDCSHVLVWKRKYKIDERGRDIDSYEWDE